MAEHVSLSVSNFSIGFYQTLALQNAAPNLFFSPWSIASAFAMVFAGAREKTADEIAAIFQWNLVLNPDFHNMMGEFESALESQNSKETYVKLANKIWVQKGMEYGKEFVSILKNQYKSDLAVTDFINHSPEAIKEINAFVADHTEQKVRDLFPPDSLTSTSRLAIANAIYFKGAWKAPFDKQVTMKDDFFLTETKSVKVDMMYANERLKVLFDRETKCTAVEFPYSKDSLSMVVVIPDQISGIGDLEKSLTMENIRKWSTIKHVTSIDIFLPRFRITQSIDLKDILSKMGIKDVFSERADMSGVTTDAKLFVSGAYHKAYVDVNEEGTEAAAATGIGMMVLSLPPQVRADRPFLFLIKENKSGVILFFGKLGNPTL